MEYVLPALAALSSPDAILAILAGTALGIVVGALPGLGSVVAITIILPFTFSMSIVPSVALVLAVYCASVYGGSISAILINTPGTPQSAATVLDGFPMARRGDAGLALGWATIASVIGGLFSTLVLVLAAPELAAAALRFGPIETFALICMALTCIAGVSRGTMLKGVLAGLLGLFLATVGSDPVTGDIRFDFGYFPLSAGIDLIPVLVGIFALAEVFARVADSKPVPVRLAAAVGMRFPPLRDWLARWRTLVKSCIIGSFIGVLPGTGAATASFISYSEAKRTGRFREHFGTGEPEGLIASESANNAVTGGALVPTLALGIPGDAVTAVMMSALIIQGVQPGVRMFADNPEIIYTCFVALVIINLVMLAMAWAGSRLFTAILRIPEPVLLGTIVVLSFVGAYGVRGNSFDLLVALVAGIAGFFLRWGGFPAAPVVIGMVLGPTLEASLRQGLIITDGSFLAFFSRPVAAGLLALTVMILLWPLIGALRERSRGRAPS
ncbi:MAG: tripartite tricarboxylate transporter permease [Alphaproteobacteria bacterium]